jgi:hypothetical protein
VKLTIHFYLKPSLRMRGVAPLLRTCLRGVHRDLTFIGVVYKVKIEHRLPDFYEIRYESTLQECMTYA